MVFGTVSPSPSVDRLGGRPLVRGRAKVVRKQPGTSLLASVTVRVALNDCQPPEAPLTLAKPPPTSSAAPVIGVPVVQGPSIQNLKPVLQTPMRDALLAEEEEGFALTHSQLQHVACDDDLRRMLRDPRLQAVIREIDGAGNRERALQLALDGDPAFQQFSDQLIGLMDRVSASGR